ncbi:glucan endo-1,3-beta-glucosidase 8 [Hevea brasiliensis]|uniref:glucan endo-1,3-beta-glucosidase 8 n=1 Tax=Hevea brasiliensis TaxID=3981 RepID=UPI0025FA74C4|nr:glucan endo-1,3-beta-glucosidase 8 [Hevea brasiliensis]
MTMNRACNFMLWSLCMLNIIQVAVSGVGVNWGSMASHPLPPDIAVKMLKDNGITKVKLFDADSWTLNSLAGSNIEVMVGIPNNMLDYISDSYDNAKDWVKENITSHLKDFGDKRGVDIRYVSVGNEPFLEAYEGKYDESTFPALQNIQKALDEVGVGDKIKASIALNADVYDGNKPSDGNFRSNVRNVMLKIVKHLQQHKAPFIVNIYPFLSVYQTAGFPVEYAFFEGSGRKVYDKNVTYSNVFDANYDTLVWALTKAGVPDLKIIVGEVGWPTDGAQYATTMYAQKFYDGLLKKLAEKKGTPLRPGILNVYLFSLLDEDVKSILPGFFERHWGLFRYDGQAKFPMDLSGQGNDKMLIAAKGVQYMQKQWCVLNDEVRDESLIPSALSYACYHSDCTSLTHGSSCGNLDLRGNASYAFNMYFQMNSQDVEACDFNGLGTIVTRNASRGTCLFPVQIVSQGERVNLAYGVTIFVGFVLSFFMFM